MTIREAKTDSEIGNTLRNACLPLQSAWQVRDPGRKGVLTILDADGQPTIRRLGIKLGILRYGRHLDELATEIREQLVHHRLIH